MNILRSDYRANLGHQKHPGRILKHPRCQIAVSEIDSCNKVCNKKVMYLSYSGEWVFAPICWQHRKYNKLDKEQQGQLDNFYSAKSLEKLERKLYFDYRFELENETYLSKIRKNDCGGLQYYDFYKLAAKLAKTLIPETFIDAEQSNRLLEFYQQLSLAIHELRDLKLIVQGTRLNIVDNDRPDKVLYPNVEEVEEIEELGNLLKFDVTKRKVNG